MDAYRYLVNINCQIVRCTQSNILALHIEYILEINMHNRDNLLSYNRFSWVQLELTHMLLWTSTMMGDYTVVVMETCRVPYW